MGFLSFLFGSTATVEIDQDHGQGTATKRYLSSTKHRNRRWEKERLEDLYFLLQDNPQVGVPALLSVEYEMEQGILTDRIDSLVVSLVKGDTLDQLPHKVAKRALRLVKDALHPTGIHLPDLEGDGNLRVEWNPDTGDIFHVWIVDVGDDI